MYRHGISSERIAQLAGAVGSTVRYHLRLAVVAEPGIRTEHREALKPVRRRSKPGLANMTDVVSLFQEEGRFPSTKSKSPRERALAMWLQRRRKDMEAGQLDPVYREGLQAVPGWEQRTRKAKDEAQWNDRLSQLVAYKAAGNDWPRHKNKANEAEHRLGMWLQYQRTKLAARQLDTSKKSRLDEVLPGWIEGRSNRRSGALLRPVVAGVHAPNIDKS